MKISLLSIGNELLAGNTINTNATWIANELTAIGCEIQNQITVQDTEDSIASGLDFCLLSKPAYLIITGGLGPTDDDITMDAILKFLKIESEFDFEYWDQLKEKFNRSGLSITNSNKNQALKITVRFMSNVIQSNSLKITVHRKKCSVNQSCNVEVFRSRIQEELIASILKEATILDKQVKK